MTKKNINNSDRTKLILNFFFQKKINIIVIQFPSKNKTKKQKTKSKKQKTEQNNQTNKYRNPCSRDIALHHTYYFLFPKTVKEK